MFLLCKVNTKVTTRQPSPPTEPKWWYQQGVPPWPINFRNRWG